MQRDVVFHYNGESNTIPAAVLLLSKVMFMNIATVIMPYTKEVEQMHQSFETKLIEYRKLFVKRACGLVLSVSVSLMEEVFTKIADLGYNIILCTESVENAIRTGYFNSVSKPVSEKVLTRVDSIVTKLNYKASMRAFRQEAY